MQYNILKTILLCLERSLTNIAFRRFYTHILARTVSWEAKLEWHAAQFLARAKARIRQPSAFKLRNGRRIILAPAALLKRPYASASRFRLVRAIIPIQAKPGQVFNEGCGVFGA